MDNDRALDAWEPLFAIADMAGVEWAVRVRSAAVSLHGGTDYAEERLELLALAHVRDAFGESGEERLATTSILESLVRRDDGPWAEWWGDAVANGKPLAAARRLGRYLEPFGVKPKTVRIGGKTPRGYERADLADAWERNLPVGTETTSTTATSQVNPVADRTPVADGTATTPPTETPLASTVADVADVAVSTGAIGSPAWYAAARANPIVDEQLAWGDGVDA
jgi:hypothetical protein